MFSARKFILLAATIFFFFSAQARDNFFQQDTFHVKDGIVSKDSLVELGEVDDCFEKFFDKAEKLTDPDKTMIVAKAGKSVSVASYLKSEEMGAESQHGLADLDNDGKKELVIYNYSGGAHCCDQFFVFKNIAPDKYQLAAKTFAGNVCINDKNNFLFNFYEQFGYFFTCYACAYENTSDVAPRLVSGIMLKYNKGKLSVVPGDKELRSTIYDNLGKLGEQPYQKLDEETDQDNGLRKAVALNLAVYYFSFGKNITETKRLFDKYYKFPDSKKVWAEFMRVLNQVKLDNSF